jgi:hypothetical protein
MGGVQETGMKRGLSEETWKQLRREARDAADRIRREEATSLSQQALQEANLVLPAELEEHLKLLNEAWSLHEKPLLSKIPLLGPLFARLAAGLVRFLLQHQIAFNAEATRTLQQMCQLQQWVAREQIARVDDLYARLDEALLGLEARVRDLEEEVERLRQQS